MLNMTSDLRDGEISKGIDVGDADGQCAMASWWWVAKKHAKNRPFNGLTSTKIIINENFLTEKVNIVSLQ